MIGAALQDNVTWTENAFVGVQQQAHATADDDDHIDRGGEVHRGMA
jgi:hypothetical protein